MNKVQLLQKQPANKNRLSVEIGIGN